MNGINPFKNQFLLSSDITYLNHGGFGACPKIIFEDYQKWQLDLERGPVNFILNTGVTALNKAKKALGNYVGCNSEDIVYMPNPTTAMNTIIKSLPLNKDDEVLSTNKEYGAIERTWKYYCKKAGAKYIEQKIELPIQSKEVFLDQFWAGLTSKTRYIFLSQITSSTALIFPVAEICKKAKELGLIVIIDGAHVPGHIPLNIAQQNVDIYTGTCHKWMLTPKGSAFLFVKKELQKQFDPLIISWGYNPDTPSISQFEDFHQFNGTRDFSAYLTIPKAIEFITSNEWETAKSNCRKLLLQYYPIVANELNSKIICPLNEDFLGQICSIPINTNNPQKLKDLLFSQYKIEIPVFETDESNYIRISFQAYNDEREIEYLINIIRKIKTSTNLLN